MLVLGRGATVQIKFVLDVPGVESKGSEIHGELELQNVKIHDARIKQPGVNLKSKFPRGTGQILRNQQEP